MQVLTAQYPTLYTRKFRVFYSDFQPNATQSGLIDLFTLPAGNQIVHCAMRCNTAFTGGAFTQNQFRIVQSGQVPASGNTTGVFMQYNAFNGVNDRYGSSVWIQNRTQVTPAVSQLIWCNFNSSTLIQLSAYVTGTGSFNSLTGGAMDIWITSMRLT